MTAQPTLFFRGSVPTTLSTLYTVPSSTKIVVTSIIVANTVSSTAEITIRLGGVEILKDGRLATGDSVHFDIRQVMSTSDAIEAMSDINGVTLHVSGVEVA